MAEDKTGYRIPPIDDAKHCSNCEHFVRRESGCNGPKMKELSDRPRFENGDVKVSLIAVCKFWEPR
jgi:hypothetical protein